MLWNFWGSKHDVRTVGRRIKADANDQTRSYTVDTRQDEDRDTVTTCRPQTDSHVKELRGAGMSAAPFSDVRTRIVHDVGQAAGVAPERPDSRNLDGTAVPHARDVLPPIPADSSLGEPEPDNWNPAPDSRSTSTSTSPPRLTLPSDLGHLSDPWSRSDRGPDTADDDDSRASFTPVVVGLGRDPADDVDNKDASVLSVDGVEGVVAPIGDEGRRRSGVTPPP
ncbi:hypothetical protein VTN02DRAFT_750 [Thermoascus thermophilus]